MDPSEYKDELWDEIPGFAFMALGRRGREQIALNQCFVPSCNCNQEEKLHPLEIRMQHSRFWLHVYSLKSQWFYTMFLIFETFSPCVHC